MSECVVRMEMPENCCECQLRKEDYDTGEEFCPFTGVECLSIGRQDNCPIVCALPENHGRLVDAGRFERNMYVEWANGELSNSDWIDFRQWLKDEETVVPASDEERSENESD